MIEGNLKPIAPKAYIRQEGRVQAIRVTKRNLYAVATWIRGFDGYTVRIDDDNPRREMQAEIRHYDKRLFFLGPRYHLVIDNEKLLKVPTVLFYEWHVEQEEDEAD